MLAAPALAASPHPNLDANGVDLTDGSFNLNLPIASIGAGQARMDLVAYDGKTDNYTQMFATQSVSGGTTSIVINMGPQFDNFSSANGFASSLRGTGATLTFNADNSITYRTLDGLVVVFGNPAEPQGGASNLCDPYNNANCTRLATSASVRSGMSLNYNWLVHANCPIPANPDDPIDCTYSWRLASVGNDAGYSINWTFADNGAWSRQNPGTNWYRRTSAQLRNANVSAPSWPTVTYANPSTGVYTITTPGGKTWRITASGQQITAIRRPSASSDTTTIAYGASAVVSSVTTDGVTTTYNRTVSGNTATMVVTDAQSHTTTIVSDMTKYRPTSVTNALGQTVSMIYDSVGRPTEISQPEGNKVQYTYDGRGNVTAQTFKAKAGSGLSDLVLNAGYDTTCTNVVTCNQPNWTKDAKGNQTDYTYDATTGQLLTVTLPAATAGANRPQTRYSYTALNTVSLLTGVSTCQVNAAPGCVGTADEVKTTTSYNSNLLPTSVSSGAGDASLTATTATGYDAIGNVLTVDGPLSGAADTTTYRYDADRALVGIISADPDGAGALVRRAVKTTYNTDGQPTITEVGTVNGTTDSDWAAFATAQQSTTTYDANARPTKSTVTAGGTTYAVTQYSYDSVGRLECTAQRMDPAQWASQTNACAPQTTGANGPDRITKTVYDAAGQVTQVLTAYGTTDQATEVTNTFTANGKLAILVDGEGNLTDYSYDGHDRLITTRYPSATVKGSVNPADYENLTYDANGNVTQRRLRDGLLINYTYDNLDRLTFKDMPNYGYHEADVTYAYDLLGRMTGLSTPDGNYFNHTFDALGRATTEASWFGTKSMQYDLAGRMTRLTWPDAFYVTYDYDVTGNVTVIRENGAASGVGVLATYGYDNLGRRTSLTRGNGTTTSYSFDPVSRLSSLTQDLAGTAKDLTINGFAYNPASQIGALTRSNDAYAWNGHYNVNRNYTVNGLNQMTAAGGTGIGYDGRGNLTSSGASTYQYTSDNRLATTGSGVYLANDGAGRLVQVYANGGANVTPMDYLGQTLISEFNGSNQLIRRYVHGPGADEPLVWYEGSGTSDRRWLHTDERGSVIAVSNASGSSIATNSYDEYGIPASTNLGRFGYTGQAWLSELGMWYYKARMYSPTLGRFMQTDPIGYADGINWYNYVGSDPINGTDPSGLSVRVGNLVCSHGIESNGHGGWKCDDGGGSGGGAGGSFRNGGGGSVYIGIAGRGPSRGSDGTGAPEIIVTAQNVTCPTVKPGTMGKITENQVAATRPGWQVIRAYRAARISLAEAQAKFSRSQRWNGPGDAWRHFRWNFSMAQSMGSRAASAFANAHEVSNPNDAAEHAMDMYNNAMGRAFGSNPAYAELSPSEAADLALRSGCLQTSK